MKTYNKTVSRVLPLVLATVSFMLTVGGVQKAAATGNVPTGIIAAGAKARVNNLNSGGGPLTKEAKGAKVFGVDTAASLVTDEQGVTPTAGGLAAMEIGVSGGGIGAALPVCYLLVYDSSVASDTTESGSVSRLLVPPLQAGLSVIKNLEFAYPKQFNKGLVVLMGGAGAASCRGSISFLTNGGAD